MRNCKYCGATLDEDALFCVCCGKKIEPQGNFCPHCGKKVEDDSVFCTGCGTKLDTLVASPMVPSSEEEVMEEEKNRTWWHVIGVIAIVGFLAIGGYYAYKHFNKTIDEESVELSTDEEAFFIELVKQWDETHNNKEFDEGGENNPYSENVCFYGTNMSGLEAHLKKWKALRTLPDFKQESTNIKVTKISEKLVVCDFDKHTYSNGKSKVHYGCYLYFVDEGGGMWKIKEESDSESDNHVRFLRSKGSSGNVGPLTLQFIREYCDYLQLPYRYWNYVEKKIEEYGSTVLIREGVELLELEAQPYVLRARIAMDYNYMKQGNDVLNNIDDKDYVNFCDAIGRIKDVWNVVPVRIENNNESESPLYQFYYENDHINKTLITAIRIVDEVDEYEGLNEPIAWHYKFVGDNNKEVTLDLVSY